MNKSLKFPFIILIISVFMTPLGYFSCIAMEERREEPSHSTVAAPLAKEIRMMSKRGNLENLVFFLQSRTSEHPSFKEIFYRECPERQAEEGSQGSFPKLSSLRLNKISLFQISPEGKRRLCPECFFLTKEAQENQEFLDGLKRVVDFSCTNISDQFYSLSSQQDNPLHRFSFTQVKIYFVSVDKEKKDPSLSLRSLLEERVCMTQKQNVLLTGNLSNGNPIEIDLEAELTAPLRGEITGVSYIGNLHNGEIYVFAHTCFPISQDVQFVDISTAPLLALADANPFSNWISWRDSAIHGVLPKKHIYTRFSYDKEWWENWSSYCGIQGNNLKLQALLHEFSEGFLSEKKENPTGPIGETLIDLPKNKFYQIIASQALESNSLFYPGPQSINEIRYLSTQQLWVRPEKTSEVLSFAAFMMTPLTLHFLNCIIPENIPPGMYSCETNRPRASQGEASESALIGLSLQWSGKEGSVFPIQKKDRDKPYRFEVFDKGQLVPSPPFFRGIEEEEAHFYTRKRKEERHVVASAIERSSPALSEGSREGGAAALKEEDPSEDGQLKKMFLDMLTLEKKGPFQENSISYHTVNNPKRVPGHDSEESLHYNTRKSPHYSLLEINCDRWTSSQQDAEEGLIRKKETEINLRESQELDRLKKNPWTMIQSLITQTGHYFSEREPSPGFKLSLLDRDSRSFLDEVSDLKKHTWVESSSDLSLHEYLEQGICEITSHITLFSGILRDGRRLYLTIAAHTERPLMAKIIGFFYAVNSATKEIYFYFHTESDFLRRSPFVLASKTFLEAIPNPSHHLADWVYWDQDNFFYVNYEHPIFKYPENWKQRWVLENSDGEDFFCRTEDSFLEEDMTKGGLFGKVPLTEKKDPPSLFKVLKMKRRPSSILCVLRGEPHLKSVETLGVILRQHKSSVKISKIIYRIGSSEIIPLNFAIPRDLSSGIYEITQREEDSLMTWKAIGIDDSKKAKSSAASEAEVPGTPLEKKFQTDEKENQNKPFGFRLRYEKNPSDSLSQLALLLKDAESSLFLTSVHLLRCPNILHHVDALLRLPNFLFDLSFKNCALRGDLPDVFFECLEIQENLRRFDFSGNPISEDSFNKLILTLSFLQLQELSIDGPRKKSSSKKRGAAGGLTGAASGAAAGFFLAGPPGAFAGAILGGVTGGTSAAKASSARAFAKRNKASDFTIKSFIKPVEEWKDLTRLSIHNVKRSDKGCTATKTALDKMRTPSLRLPPLEIKIFPRSSETEKDTTSDQSETEDIKDEFEGWENIENPIGETSEEDD